MSFYLCPWLDLVDLDIVLAVHLGQVHPENDLSFHVKF